MSPIKEPSYFARADLLSNDWYRERIERDRPRLRAFLDGPRTKPIAQVVTDWDDYQSLFRDVGEETAIGESSVGYFAMPSAAAAIRAAIPDARIIFILRDPAERLASRFVTVMNTTPGTTFGAWLDERDRIEPGWLQADNARYATNLRRFFEVFSRHQIQVHLYEDFTRDPASIMRAIFSFLDVDADCAVDVSTRHNTSSPPRYLWMHGIRRKLLRDSSLTRWLPPRAAEIVRRAYRRRRADFRLSPKDRQMVIERYRDEIEATAELLGRDLSGWLR